MISSDVSSHDPVEISCPVKVFGYGSYMPFVLFYILFACLIFFFVHEPCLGYFYCDEVSERRNLGGVRRVHVVQD